MTPSPTQQTEPPSVRSRIVALLAGTWYVFIMADILSQTTGTPPTRSLLLVSIAAAVIMAVMVVFGVKAYKQQGPVRQFQLSSLFLLIIPIAIYSTAIRSVVATVPSSFSALGWLIVGVYSVLFVVMSTAMLLWLADALMWLTVLIVRIAGYVRQSDSET